MLKKFLAAALLACVALNSIVQAEESATEKRKDTNFRPIPH